MIDANTAQSVITNICMSVSSQVNAIVCAESIVPVRNLLSRSFMSSLLQARPPVGQSSLIHLLDRLREWFTGETNSLLKSASSRGTTNEKIREVQSVQCPVSEAFLEISFCWHFSCEKSEVRQN